MQAGAKQFWLPALLLLVASSAARAEDIASFNTIQTRSDATIDKIKISNPKFSFRRILLQKYGGLEQPVVSFSISNMSSIPVRTVVLSAQLKDPGRAVPLAAPRIHYKIPGGLQPGETKHFTLDADILADWNGVARAEATTALFSLTVSAVEDAEGDLIVR